MSMTTEINPISLTASLAENVDEVLSGERGQEIEGDFPLDPAVIARTCPLPYTNLKTTKLTLVPRQDFPAGTQVHSCYSHGQSKWTVTAKITTTLPNGDPRVYFLKVETNPTSRYRPEADWHIT